MAGKKFSWGRKHTIISAIAVVVIGAIAWILLATSASSTSEKSAASQQAACQSFASIVKEASSKESLEEGVSLLIKGASDAAKVADPGKELAKQLTKLGSVKIDEIDLESADTAAAFGARIEIINELCSAEFASTN
jgi:hypothetical protein